MDKLRISFMQTIINIRFKGEVDTIELFQALQ